MRDYTASMGRHTVSGTTSRRAKIPAWLGVAQRSLGKNATGTPPAGPACHSVQRATHR